MSKENHFQLYEKAKRDFNLFRDELIRRQDRIVQSDIQSLEAVLLDKEIELAEKLSRALPQPEMDESILRMRENQMIGGQGVDLCVVTSIINALIYLGEQYFMGPDRDNHVRTFIEHFQDNTGSGSGPSSNTRNLNEVRNYFERFLLGGTNDSALDLSNGYSLFLTQNPIDFVYFLYHETAPALVLDQGHCRVRYVKPSQIDKHSIRRFAKAYLLHPLIGISAMSFRRDSSPISTEDPSPLTGKDYLTSSEVIDQLQKLENANYPSVGCTTGIIKLEKPLNISTWSESPVDVRLID